MIPPRRGVGLLAIAALALSGIPAAVPRRRQDDPNLVLREADAYGLELGLSDAEIAQEMLALLDGGLATVEEMKRRLRIRAHAKNGPGVTAEVRTVTPVEREERREKVARNLAAMNPLFVRKVECPKPDALAALRASVRDEAKKRSERLAEVKRERRRRRDEQGAKKRGGR